MSRPDLEVVVVGAGVAGLAAARELQAAGREVLVLDAGERAGGVMRTDEVRGFRIERGPNAFRVPAEALAFLRRHRLEEALLPAGPEASLRHLYRQGRLEPLPGGIWDALRTPLLSSAGKLRALREPFVPRGEAGAESVGEFVSRRFGSELLEGAVAPFLIGVYAGDESRLGAEAVFPALVGWERSHGSVLRGALAQQLLGRRPAPSLRGSHSAQGGLGELAAHLGVGLGARLRLGSRVEALAPEAGGWRLELAGESLRAGAVLLACDAAGAARLLRPLAPEAADGLEGIEYAPLVSLALDVEPAPGIRGFGFLVPREAGLELLGALFMSRVFPGRAPAGRELVMAMLGGLREPGAVDEPEDRLLERARRGLERTLGVREAPRLLAVSRWPRAVPQPARDHRARVARLRERTLELPGLALAGGYLDGVSVADSLVSGVRAAAELDAA